NGCGNGSDSMSKEARKKIAHRFNRVRQFNDKATGWSYPYSKNMYKLQQGENPVEEIPDPARSQMIRGEARAVGCSTTIQANTTTYTSKPTANQTFADAYSYWAGNSSRKAPSTNKSGVYYDDGNQTANITFLNMIRASITAVGCSTLSCPSGDCYIAVVSCLFNRAPLSCGDPVYHFGGGGCESGSNCTTYSNSTCNGGLCYKSALPMTTNTTVAPTHGRTCARMQNQAKVENASSVAQSCFSSSLHGSDDAEDSID
ncbi:hypothetical protein OSTOST_05491, partial [Ostertagia ostertagi]